MSNVDKIAKDLAGIIKNSDSKATAPYDTKATVKKVENGIAWVQIPGGVDETPVQMTLSAKAGDTVQVRVSGGRAWITGNGTNPPTDDTRANAAHKVADKAYSVAENAILDAQRAHEAADSAEASAEQAQTSAENAGEYAARALGNLSTVQSVTETLNWITAHGTMTLTTDTALDPTHVYFVRDNNGDYEVGNYHYSVVTEPKLEDISTYYVLSIDESLNNYVGTHLAVTSEGLWLIPEAGGNKVLIATGQGSTYTSAGTYIIDGNNHVLAQFLASRAIIGVSDGTQSFLSIDYHSLQMTDKEGSAYVHFSDLRDNSGIAQLNVNYTGDGENREFYLDPIANTTSYTVTVDGVEVVSDISKSIASFLFDTAPPQGARIVAAYTSRSSYAKAFTIGTRGNGNVGAFSYAEGVDVLSNGHGSHAEGCRTKAGVEWSHAEGLLSIANATAAHAEGYNTDATGPFSHAQNEGTRAQYKSQTVLGTYNDNKSTSAVEIGNGKSSHRSNALTVDWQGNVELALDTTAASGTTDGDLYAAITALGWQNDVIV